MNKKWTPSQEVYLKQLIAEELHSNVLYERFTAQFGENFSFDAVSRKVRRLKKLAGEIKDLRTTSHSAVTLVEPASDKILSVLGVFDAHYPFQIDNTPLLNYGKEIGEDIIVFGGDMIDFEVISHHRKAEFAKDGFDNIQARFEKEREGFIAWLRTFKDAFPKAKFVYLIGNHEIWLEKFVTDFPQLQKITIEGILQEAIPDMAIVPQGGFYRVGKMLLCHGDNFGTANPAKQAVERIHNYSVAMGHHHKYCVWSNYSMADSSQKHIGVCVPTFGTLQPKYIRNRAHQWSNGFLQMWVKPSGNFTSIVVGCSPKGNFLINGKEYTKEA